MLPVSYLLGVNDGKAGLMAGREGEEPIIPLLFDRGLFTQACFLLK